MIFSKSKFLYYGLPFITLVVAGSFGLKQFSQIRYQFRRTQLVTAEEAEKLQMKKPGEVTLESEYEKIKEMDIDNWAPIRGPRPWEEEQQNSSATE